MAINMNADVGAMIKGLFSKKASQGKAKAPQNPYVKTLISIVTVLILIASYIYFIYLPTQEELRINNEKLSQIEILRSEITRKIACDKKFILHRHILKNKVCP